MYDVTALGEVLIDFTPYGTSEGGQALFEQNPGGAPAMFWRLWNAWASGRLLSARWETICTDSC